MLFLKWEKIIVGFEWSQQKLYIKLVHLPLLTGQGCDQYRNERTEIKIIAAQI